MLLKEALHGYLMDCQIERQSPGTLRLKRQRLGRFMAWCGAQEVASLDSVTPNVVRAFLVHLQERTVPHKEKVLAASTIDGYLGMLAAFFSWCEREDLLAGRANPTARIRGIKLPQCIIYTFTPAEMDAMLAVCNRDTALGYRDYTMLLVLMDTGIRASELLGLTLDSIHENYLTVFGKGEKEREVGLGPTAGKAMWKYINQHRKPRNEHERHVFLSRAGRPLSYMSLWNMVRVVGEHAHVQRVRLSPHTFRHTFAVSWLANGGDVFKLSRILGHTEVQTTQMYLRDFQSRDARADHALFSPVEKFRLGRRSQRQKRADEAAG